MSIDDQLMQLAGDDVTRNEPMSRHTSFHIGGNADYFVTPSGIESLQALLSLAKSEDIPVMVIGRGTNLLVGDKGIRGMVISLEKGFSYIRLGDSGMVCGAGGPLGLAAMTATKAGLGDMCFATGIPGSVGGGVYMNAGAYGGEIVNVIEAVTVLNEAGQIERILKQDLGLGYRTSRFNHEKSVLLEAEFGLTKGDPCALTARAEEFNRQRKEKQPLEYPSAGSTFKRPAKDFAGRLIMEAGCRGLSVGDAQVSEKHCGFVINKGHARALDVLALCDEVKERVYRSSGIMLEPEVCMVGEF